MNHRSARRQISGYLDGTLSANRRRQLDEHLEGCAHCSDEVRELRETVALLRGLPEPEPAENLAQTVLRRVAAGEAESTWRARADGWLADVSDALSSPRIALPAAVLVAVVAVVGIGPNFQLFPSSSSSPQGVASAPAMIAASGTPSSPQPAARSSASRRLRNPEMPDPMQFAPGPRGRLVRASAGSGGQRPALAETRNGMPIRGDGALLSADDWIEVLIRRPANFTLEHARLSDIERELWVTYLARRALETERLDSLVQALRRSSEPSAAALADDFALLGGRR